MPQTFEFCGVCRQNHNLGRRHLYTSKHKKTVDVLLQKMLGRIEEILQFVKNPVRRISVVRDGGNKFWCHFCEKEILENQSLFASAQAITHLTSESHAENTKRFWAENGVDKTKQSLYIIERTDLATWEEGCKVVPALARVDDIQSNVSNTSPHEEGLMTTHPIEGAVQRLQRLNQGSADKRHPSLKSENGNVHDDGNVHSGAPPPWLKQIPLVFEGDSSSSELLPLSKTQQAKLAKLRNPNRVGAAWADRRRAELEREQRGETVSTNGKVDPLWLPSFGRVWQSGPRQDTRKEFEAEKHSKVQNEGRTGKAKMKAESEDFKFKPYVSKKQKQIMDSAKS